MHARIVLVIAMSMAACAAAPTTRPSDIVRSLKEHPTDFRFQLICIDHDQRQESRDIDFGVSDDEGAVHSAEGLVSAAQAARVMDLLANDGLFDRATPDDDLPRQRPAQPYYIAQITIDRRGRDLFEFRPADARLLELMISM